MTLRYSTLLQVRTFGSLGDEWDDELAVMVEAAEEEVDNYCGRRFDQITETRTLRIRTTNVVPCGDWVSVGTVVVDGVALAPGDWQARTYPTTSRPARDLRLIGHRANPGDTAIVTGTFGWPTVPRAVTAATVILAQRLFGRGESAMALASHPETGHISPIPRQDPDVRRLLNPYRIPKYSAGLPAS